MVVSGRDQETIWSDFIKSYNKLPNISYTFPAIQYVKRWYILSDSYASNRCIMCFYLKWNRHEIYSFYYFCYKILPNEHFTTTNTSKLDQCIIYSVCTFLKFYVLYDIANYNFDLKMLIIPTKTIIFIRNKRSCM